MSPAGQQQLVRQRQPQQLSQSQLQHKKHFLSGLAAIHLARKDPLPPALTGVPYPAGFDPNQSKWKSLEPSQTEGGSVMLAGKPVDLYKLWATVTASGGWAKLTQERLWSSIALVFDLPESYPINGVPAPVAHILGQYYKAIVLPFEEISRKQRPVLGVPGGQSQQAGQHTMIPSQIPGGDMGAQGVIPPAIPHMDGGSALPPQHPFSSSQTQRQPSVGMSGPSLQLQSPDMLSNISQPFLSQASPDGSQLSLHGQTPPLSFDADADGRKRKGTSEADAKRVRQRTVDSPDTTVSNADRTSAPPTGEASGDGQPSAAPATSQQPDASQRRKVEYVPVLREVDTLGGRDLRAIAEGHHRLTARHALRDISEWGNIDIDALTMSLRSRISIETGYALTTFTLLSIMRGQGTSGFPIANCPELMDEALDLLLEVSFNEQEQDDAFTETVIIPHRQLVDTILEDGSKPFASLDKVQGMKNYDQQGPKQRPGDIVLAIVNIMRNLSVIPDNYDYLANHERLLAAMLRVCAVRQKQDGTLHAASSALTLRDLVAVRRDVLYLLINLSGSVRLAPSMVLASTPSPAALQVARRAFMLMASFLVYSSETVNPSELYVLTGTNANVKPPALVDAALEVLGRFGQPDTNRQVIAKAVPQEWLRRLFEALMRRLPVVDADFQIAKREPWLSYIEKVIMGLYAIAFLAPPSMKEQLKKDHQLGFTRLMLRLVKKFTINVPQEMRPYFSVCAKRAVETLKVVDDGEDAFEMSQNTGSVTLSFGVGYGEVGEDHVEKGTGSLSGFQEEVVWGIMLQKDVDDSMFRELDSLARVA
jgi:SWI/SNF chromatin-remodeling complex subunit SWI1